ncbi:MAG: hypothetical protein AAFY82_05005 [Pseudomonadota bacterium]
MKHLIAAVAAITVMTACNGAPPNQKVLTDLCSDLFVGDTRTAGMITGEAGTDLATFCSCFAAQTVAEADKIDVHKDILLTMVEIRSAGNLTVEDTADALEAKFDSGDIDGISEQDFDDLGDYFQDLSIEMKAAGGTCPVS